MKCIKIQYLSEIEKPEIKTDCLPAYVNYIYFHVWPINNIITVSGYTYFEF